MMTTFLIFIFLIVIMFIVLVYLNMIITIKNAIIYAEIKEKLKELDVNNE